MINREAESLNFSVSGGPEPRLIADPFASAGEWVVFDANSQNDYIQFIVPNVPAGSYQVQYRYKAFSVRGIVQMSIGEADGSNQINQGPVKDQSEEPNNTYTTIDLETKTFSANDDYTFRFTTTAAGSGGNYKISVDKISLIPVSVGPLELEAEFLTTTFSNGSIRLIDDIQASGGRWVLLENNNVNDYIQFLVENVTAGEYLVQYRYKSFSVRGIVQMSIGNADGSNQINQGPVKDQSEEPDNTYTTIDLGTKTFSANDDYTFRFTTTAAGGGGNYKISVDKISLIPVSVSVSPPSNFSSVVTSDTSMRLTWVASPSSLTGYRIERRQSGGSWTFIGDAPANAISFESVGMGGNQSWEHRIQAFNNSGVSNYVNSGFETTPAAISAPIGFLIAENDATHPRKGEGAIVIKNGLVRYYFGRYQGSGDAAPASIYLRTSDDEGDTWSDETAVFSPPSGRTYILPSVINLPDGNLGLSYVDLATSNNNGKRIFRVSENAGAAWSAPIDVSDSTFARMTGSHDRICKSNGRLLYPIHARFQSSGNFFELATYVYVSDNNGLNWIRKGGPLRQETRLHGGNYGFWESSITTTNTPDKLIMVGRTDSGFIYKSVSMDNGDTWSEPTTTNIIQWQAPPHIKQIPGENTLVLVFEPWYTGPFDRPVLGSFISNDEGETWENFKIIEYDGNNAFHYCSIYFDSNKDAYLTYYGRNGGGIDFGGSRFRKLPSEWFKT